MPGLFENYNNTRNLLKQKAKQNEKAFSYLIASIVLSLIIMIGPMVVLGNCFIFNDFIYLVFAGFVVCITMLVYLSRVFYFLVISQKEVPNMGLFLAVDGMLFLIFAIVGAFIVYYL